MDSPFLSNLYCKLTGFRDMSMLRMRSRILVWGFQSRKKDFKDFEVFSPLDLIRFPTGVLARKYPGRYLKFIIRLWVYRKNITTPTWSALAKFYHRPLALWYYFSLFWWAEYCGVLSELLKAPDRSLVAELFLRYIIKIDEIIDEPGGKRFLFEDLPSLKQRSSDVLNELLRLINKHASLPQQRKMIDIIWRFRKSTLTASRQIENCPDASFDTLIEYKNRSAGDLLRVWVDILCMSYEVEIRAEKAREIFRCLMMAVQVIDDMLDAPFDHRDDASNIFIGLLEESPDEYDAAREYFENYHCDYLDWIWANKHLPNTCVRAVVLINSYLNVIKEICTEPALASELCASIEDWKLIGPNEGKPGEKTYQNKARENEHLAYQSIRR